MYVLVILEKYKLKYTKPKYMHFKVDGDFFSDGNPDFTIPRKSYVESKRDDFHTKYELKSKNFQINTTKLCFFFKFPENFHDQRGLNRCRQILWFFTTHVVPCLKYVNGTLDSNGWSIAASTSQYSILAIFTSSATFYITALLL